MDEEFKTIKIVEQPVELAEGFLTRYWNSDESLPKLGKVESVVYFFQQAFRNMKALPMSNAIAVITVALSVFLLGGFILLLQNFGGLIRESGNSSTVMVYLQDEIPQKKLSEFVREMENSSLVESVDYISPKDALELFRKDLGSESDFLDGLDGNNPLPGSVELKLKSNRNSEEDLQRLGLSKRSYVTDVITGSEWVEHTRGVLNVMRFLGVAISLILLFVMVFLISNTIRLVIFYRQREIEIMRLVGATREFVQVPYIAGGALQGFVGSMMGLMLLSGIYLVLNSEFSQIRELMAVLPELKYLNRFVIIFLVLGGTVVGGVGSFFATRKLVDV